MPKSPARIKSISVFKGSLPRRFGQINQRAIKPITNRIIRISTGLKQSSRIFVEMNVIPQTKIVKNAAICPKYLLSAIINPFLVFKRGKPYQAFKGI